MSRGVQCAKIHRCRPLGKSVAPYPMRMPFERHYVIGGQYLKNPRSLEYGFRPHDVTRCALPRLPSCLRRSSMCTRGWMCHGSPCASAETTGRQSVRRMLQTIEAAHGQYNVVGVDGARAGDRQRWRRAGRRRGPSRAGADALPGLAGVHEQAAMRKRGCSMTMDWLQLRDSECELACVRHG